MTKEEAIKAKHGDAIYSANLRGRDKRPIRIKVSGKCVTYQTRPDDFQLPVAYKGVTDFYITPKNADNWYVREAEAAAEFIARACFDESSLSGRRTRV